MIGKAASEFARFDEQKEKVGEDGEHHGAGETEGASAADVEARDEGPGRVSGILIKRAFDYHLVHPDDLQSKNIYSEKRRVCEEYIT